MNTTLNTTHSVYSITVASTGRQYFGSTSDLAVRWDTHRGYFSLGRHANKELQEQYNLVGLRGLVFDVLKSNMSEKEADRLERKLIASNPDCFNIRKRGPGSGRVNRITAEGYGKNGCPMLNIAQVKAILALKGKMFGYQIAQKFDVSPSLVSMIFTGKYGSGYKSLRSA